MRNQLKFAGVPQTNETISATSGPKFAILWGHVVEVLLFNKFFPIVDTCLSCKDSARQSCAMVRRWRFFASFLYPVFPARRVQHISDQRSGEEKKKKKKRRKKPQGKNIMSGAATQGGHKNSAMNLACEKRLEPTLPSLFPRQRG